MKVRTMSLPLNGRDQNTNLILNEKQQTDQSADEILQAPAIDDSAIEPQGQRIPEADDSISILEEVYKIATEAHVRCFRDQHGDAFVWVPADAPLEHWECLLLKSRAFRTRLAKLAQRKNKRRPKLKELHEAVSLLELDADLAEAKEIHTRTAWEKGNLFIDLADAAWRMIKINARGWEVVPQTEPRFTRYPHQKPLCEPVAGGDPHKLFEFIPITDPQENLLLLAWMLVALNPQVTSPILILVGPQGSAKTTSCRRMRSLLDPSKVDMLGETELAQLVQTFAHHAVPCFENVSNFRRRTADMFCRATTGTGIERRKLFTDSESVLFSFRRAIMINGISVPTVRPDFLDRCLVIRFDRLKDFTPLQNLDADFLTQQPALLGSLLDLLVKTLQAYETTPNSSDFRMADFASFGRAMAVALGNTPEAFDAAYRANSVRQAEDFVDGSSLAQLISVVAANYGPDEPWKPTAKEILEELKVTGKGGSKLNAFIQDLPKSGCYLSTSLLEISPLLERLGIFVKKMKRSGKRREWEIYRQAPQRNNGPTEFSEQQQEIHETLIERRNNHAN